MKYGVGLISAGLLVAAMAVSANAQKLTQRPDLSCGDWYKVCKKRGGTTYCEQQLAICKSTGCWTEGAKYGNDKWCSLQRK